MSGLRARPRSARDDPLDDDLLLVDALPDDGTDLDVDAGNDSSGSDGRSLGPVRRRAHRVLAVTACAAVVVVLVASLVRHDQHREVLAAAAQHAAQVALADEHASAWQAQQRRSAEHARREVAALALLPEDLAFQQRTMADALRGAAPRLPDLDWSTATTRTVRTTAQRLGDGSPRLLDAVRTAQPSPGDGAAGLPAVPVSAAVGTQVVGLSAGSSPTATVAWRITTPLTSAQVTDPCSVPGVLPVPDGRDGSPAPACTVRTVTSATGEQQVVARWTWQRVVGGPGDDATPVREVTVHQAVLLVEQRWTFSVASTAVGRPGTAASVPLLSLDQADLAVRWAADAVRGLPTPAPLRGTPLPGFAG